MDMATPCMWLQSLQQKELQMDNPQSPTSENQIETARESSSPSILSTTSLYSLYVPSSPNSSNDEDKDSIWWIISGVDISETCHKYRVEVIDKCKSMAIILDAFEEL
ncbi:10583_t:CDS:2 [Entrophospora sp. SA101]|nr:10583_t:CDS:2 [Entrophospora sp. SA101]